MRRYARDATARATRLSVHTILMYRYLWTCRVDRWREGLDRHRGFAAQCAAGVLCLVASLCITALAWVQGLLARSGSLPGRPQAHRDGRRLGALCTMLSLLTLLVVSGPHLVHHLADLSPQNDHHTPTGSAHPLPDCLVFLVMQHTPVAASVLAHALIPLAAGEPIVCTPPLWMSEAPRYVSQARAPPSVFLSRTFSECSTLYESAA